jgi:prepilin-type N-terminal cleavage/methylation domain-containing protein/prepilin-type processing-associated H-X9-DG protein
MHTELSLVTCAANRKAPGLRAHAGTRSGFSLIELVVVLAVLGILAALILAGVQRVRDAAARAACASNLRQLALAAQMYAGDRHHFPRGCDQEYSRALNHTSSPLGLSWHTSILPYVEQAPLWLKVDAAHHADPRGDSEAHAVISSTPIPVFLCPADGRPTATDGFGAHWGLTGYRGIAGTGHRNNDGIFHVDLVVRPTDVTDGLSNTLMIGERPAITDGRLGGWYAVWGYQVCPLTHILGAGSAGWIPSEAVGCSVPTPTFAPGRMDSLCDIGHFWSLHATGANFAFADGSVRFLRYSAAPILPALATRAGGEAVSLPD